MPDQRGAEIGIVLPRVEPFLSDCREQLESTPHFGALSEMLCRTDPPSRFDYVKLLVGKLTALAKRVRGLGLGSANLGLDKESKIADWTGLEVAQAWSVLLNAGHLFGTFATERGVLFEMHERPALKNVFIQVLQKTPGEDGAVIAARLEGEELRSFHYLLALWRLRDEGPSELSDKERLIGRELMTAFLRPRTSRLLRLKATFRRVRLLAYTELHAKSLDLRHRVEVREEDFDELFAADGLPEASDLAARRWRAIQAIDQYEVEHHFASDQAAHRVLQNSREMKRFASTMLDVDEPNYHRFLDRLFLAPNEWPILNDDEELRHCATLRFLSRGSWLNEVRIWRGAEHKKTWRNAKFLISPHPSDDLLRVDVYLKGTAEVLSGSAMAQICRRLAPSFSIDTARSTEVLQSAARFAAQIFRAQLAEAHSLSLRPVGVDGYVALGDTFEMTRGLVARFISKCEDRDRATELRGLLHVVSSLSVSVCPSVVFLARTEVFRHGDESSVCVGELDGLVGFVMGGEIHWLLTETKARRQSGGSSQLLGKAGSALKVSLEVSGPVDHAGYKTWWAILGPHRSTLYTAIEQRLGTDPRPSEDP